MRGQVDIGSRRYGDRTGDDRENVVVYKIRWESMKGKGVSKILLLF